MIVLNTNNNRNTNIRKKAKKVNTWTPQRCSKVHDKLQRNKLYYIVGLWYYSFHLLSFIRQSEKKEKDRNIDRMDDGYVHIECVVILDEIEDEVDTGGS